MISLQYSGTRWNSPERQIPWSPHRWKGTYRRSLQMLFFGTKLEHQHKECYMWITGIVGPAGAASAYRVSSRWSRSQMDLETLPELKPDG